MTKQVPLETVLVVGLGSIGKRHVNLLKEILPDIKVVALRHLDKEIKKGQKIDFIVSNLKEALHLKPSFAIISNPSSMHIDSAMPLAEAGVHLFIEKPISSSLKNVENLINCTKKNQCKLMIGYNLRFSPSLNFFREEIYSKKIGRILSVRCEVGQNIESWRPEKQYFDSVSAKKDLGGGVLLELSHVLDYLSWIFGSTTWVSGHVFKQSKLKIDVEDTVHCILGYKFKNEEVIANVSLDFIRQDPVRNCIVVGEAGSLKWNGLKNSVEIYTKEDKEWRILFQKDEHRNFTYKKELMHFIDCILNDDVPVISGKSALNTLITIENIRKSSIEKKTLTVDYLSKKFDEQA